MTRPYIGSVKAYTWRDADGTPTHGLALMAGRKVLVHLTPAEAYQLSDQLTDIADRIENKETTDAATA